MRKLLVVFILLGPLYSNAGDEDTSLQFLLQQKANDLMKLPPIEYEPNKYWFKSNGSVVDPPSHDFFIEVKSANFVSANVSYLYFLDLKTLEGYLQVRGGVTDKVNWYGPFLISDKLFQKVKDYSSECKSSGTTFKGDNK